MVITQDHWGGAQRYVFDVVTGLSNEFNWVVAIGETSSHPESLSSKLTVAGVIVEPLTHLKRAISPRHDLAARKELLAVAKAHNVDIMHAHSSKAMAIVASISKELPHTMATIHGWVSTERLSALRKVMYSTIEMFAAQNLDMLITPDTFSESIAKDHKARAVTTIPHGIGAIEFFSPEEARKELGLPVEGIVFGVIANWYPTKNIPMLIRAFAAAFPNESDKHLALIGDGPERATIERTITELGIANRVHTLGTVPNASQYCTAFTAGVLPSTKEGYPYVLLEMMQAGIPIIASDLPGIAESCANYSGATLVTPTQEALQNALQKNTQTSSQTKTQPTLSAMLLQTSRVYQELLNS